MNKREAVEKIKNVATTAHVVSECKRALADGSDGALTRALVESKNTGQTLVVVNIANEQLGYDTNDTRRY